MSDTTFVTRVTKIATAWAQAVNDWIYKGRSPLYVTSSGSVNAYLVTLPATSLYSALASGDTFTFKSHAANTSAATLSIVGASTLTAKNLYLGGSALVGGEIQIGDIVTVKYDGTQFQISSVTPYVRQLALSTGSSRIGFASSGSALTAGTVASALNDLCINVKNAPYLAKGNGTTDDTTAIADAIADASGRVLFFPKGTYLVSNLAVTADMEWVGEPGTTIKQKDATDDDLIEVSGTSKRVAFRGITFDGNESNQTAESAISIIDASNRGTEAAPGELTVEGCKFINQSHSSVRVAGSTTDAGQQFVVRVHHNTFVGGQDGVDGGSDFSPRYVEIKDALYVDVSHNHFDIGDGTYSVGVSGVVISGTSGNTDSGRVTVAHNTFVGTGRDATNIIGSIDMYSYQKNIIIVGNRLEDVKARAIDVKADSADVVIANNIVSGCTATNGTATVACLSSTTTNANGRIVVTGNIIENTKFTAISLSGGSTGANVADHHLVQGNLISQVGVGSADIQYGINLSELDHFAVIGNYIEGINPDAAAVGGLAIRITSCTGSGSIVGNHMVNLCGTAILTSSSTTLHLSVVGNMIDTTTNAASFSSRGISIDSVASAQIKANTINDIEAGEIAIRVANTTETTTVSGNAVLGTTTVGFTNGGSNTKLMVENNAFPATAFHNLTIASGAITAFHEYHTVDTESAAATDDLTTINGGRPYQLLTISATNAARTVVLKDGTGLLLAGDCTLDNTEDSITLRHNGSKWVEVSRSDNGA